MFEEKQLLAMNSEITDAMAMERRSINRLLRQIYQEELKLSHNLVDTVSQSFVFLSYKLFFWVMQREQTVLSTAEDEKWASDYADAVQIFCILYFVKLFTWKKF